MSPKHTSYSCSYSLFKMSVLYRWLLYSPCSHCVVVTLSVSEAPTNFIYLHHRLSTPFLSVQVMSRSAKFQLRGNLWAHKLIKVRQVLLKPDYCNALLEIPPSFPTTHSPNVAFPKSPGHQSSIFLTSLMFHILLILPHWSFHRLYNTVILTVS